MADNRKCGWALIAGAVAGIVTMALHPTGHDFAVAGQFDAVARLNTAVHTLAMMAVALSFLGAIGLYRLLESPSRLSLSALVIYGFASVALINAAAFSGLVAPATLRHAAGAADAEAAMWTVATHYTGTLNQAFARIYVVGSSFSVLLWSLAMLRPPKTAPALGTYGAIIGPLAALAVLSGHIRLDVHGFGMIVLTQSIWFIAAGVLLMKADPAGPRAQSAPSS